MNNMGCPSAARRTRSGFSAVLKGRSYMKPPLGEYQSMSCKAPPHCYDRLDYRNRLLFQPSTYGDIDSMKRVGLVMPELEDVVFNEQFVQQPWAFPTCHAPRKKKKNVATRDKKQRSYDKIEYHIPSQFRPLSDAEKWARQLKENIRHSLSRMGVPTIFDEYLQKPRPTFKKSVRKWKKPTTEVPIADEDDLIKRAKSISKQNFKARRIPWKSLLTPENIKKIATQTASMVSEEAIPLTRDLIDDQNVSVSSQNTLYSSNGY